MSEDELFEKFRKACPQRWHLHRITSSKCVNTILWRGHCPPVFIHLKCSDSRTYPPRQGGYDRGQHPGAEDIISAGLQLMLIYIVKNGALYMANIEVVHNPPKWKLYKTVADIVEVIK